MLGGLGPESPAELVDHPRLADARLAGHEHHPAGAGSDPLDGRSQARELEIAPDHGRPRTLFGADDGAVGDALDGERGHGLRLPLQLERSVRAPREPVGDDLLRRLTDEHGTWVGVRLEAGGDVHRVAERRELDPIAGADRPRDDRPGVDADAHVEGVDAPPFRDLPPERRDVLDDTQPGTDRALGVVLVRGGCAEEGEDAVAGEVLHGPPERLDRSHHAGDGVADDELEFLGIEPLAEGGGADEVGEQGGHVTAFVPDLHARILRHGDAPDNRCSVSPPGAGRRARTAAPRALGGATTPGPCPTPPPRSARSPR